MEKPKAFRAIFRITDKATTPNVVLEHGTRVYDAEEMDAFLEAERKADAKFLEEQAARLELDIINHNCGSRGLVKGVIAALRGKAKEKEARGA